MTPLSDLPKPLPQAEFYILLALCRGESTRYPLKSMIRNDSLGAVALADSQVYRSVASLHEEGLVDLVNSNAGQAYYGIAEYGRIRLQEEMLRLDHAVAIAKYAGVLNSEVPTDIQRLLLDAGVSD